MLNKIFERVFLRKQISNSDIHGAFREYFKNSCPLCFSNLEQHLYCLFGQFIILDDNDDVVKVKNQISNADWTSISRIDPWKSGNDYLQVFLIKCPSSAKLALFYIESYAEMNIDDQVHLVDLVSFDNELNVILESKKWFVF